MQRREVILLLREIMDFPEVTPFTCVYLKPHHPSCDSENLELHIKTNGDSSTHRIITRLARKYGFLTKEESEGFVLIYTPERKPLEIMA